ncbi:MAG: type II secretion system F family protein [Planctomycetaceae bacterium]
MDYALLLPWVAAIAVGAGIWALMGLFSGKEDRALERLNELRNPNLRGDKRGEANSGGVSGVFEKAAPALSKALESKSEIEQNALKVRLANAGFPNSSAPQLYLALKFSALICGALLGGGFGLWKYGATQYGYTSIGLAAGAGFYLPEVVLWYIKSQRQKKIFLSMPDALDLLVVCVEAGLGLDAGMRRVAEELNDTAPELCTELNLSLLQLQMGRNRRDVLHDLGVRSGVDDVKALAAILIQADKFGSSIAQALRVQSDAMRVKRRQIAEEKAQKTAVQMLFPMVLFIFPGIFVVLVGPAAIRMIDQLLTD